MSALIFDILFLLFVYTFASHKINIRLDELNKLNEN